MPAHGTPQGHNRLASLPAELRVAIYKYALPSGRFYKRSKGNAATISEHVSLLLVDRITYKEALPNFIRANTILLTASDLLACAGTSLSQSIEITVCKLGGFEVGEQGEGMEQLLQLLLSMPRLRRAAIEYGPDLGDKEELRRGTAVRPFHQFKRHFPSTGTGGDYHLASLGAGIFDLRPKGAKPSPKVIRFANCHFWKAEESFAALRRGRCTEAEFIHSHGKLALDRFRRWTDKTYAANNATNGSLISLPLPVARQWVENNCAGTEMEHFADAEFMEATFEALQDWTYYEDSEEVMAWETVER